MNSTTGKMIVGVGILAIALTIAGCPQQKRQVVAGTPPLTQTGQQNRVDETPPAHGGTNKPASSGAQQAAAAQGGIVEVKQGNFEQEIIQADMPVVVECWADWCAPCHMIRPTLEQLAEEFAGKVKFVSIDVQTNQELAKQFQVLYLPTIVIISNGKEIDRAVGLLPPKELRARINKVLSSG